MLISWSYTTAARAIIGAFLMTSLTCNGETAPQDPVLIQKRIRKGLPLPQIGTSLSAEKSV